MKSAPKHTNDAGYPVTKRIDGKQRIVCLFYKRWMGMITRAYSPEFHKLNPVYVGCSVCDEWLTFSNFRRWMEAQSWKGMELDKDIISPGNKVYGPDLCCFVDKATNNLFTDNKARRGKYPVGVSFYKKRKLFQAQCKDGAGKAVRIGLYATSEEARSAYILFKARVIRSVACRQEDNRVKVALFKRADIMELELKPDK